MKAERRHELQENSLVRGVRNFPELWKDYGSKIFLVIILFLLSLALVRYWLNSRELTASTVSQQLTSARTVLEQYRQGNASLLVLDDDPQAAQTFMQFAKMTGESTLPIMFLGEDADARIRQRVWTRVEDATSDTLKNSSDTTRQAEAKLLRGDINLHFALLANAQASAAGTKPTTQALAKTFDEYIKVAKDNYTELISQAANIPPRIASAARFGMAAVHENSGNFAEARTVYDDLIKNTQDPTTKKLASARLEILARIPSNPLIGAFKQPEPAATQPATTQSATTQSATTQATQPSTLPMTAPTTATQPVATPPAVETLPAAQPAVAPATQPAATQPATTLPAQ